MRIALAAAAGVLLVGTLIPSATADRLATEATGPPPVRLYTKKEPPRRPTVAQLPKLARIAKDGITWTLSAPAPVGRFVTGDYYVVGPVTVTAVTPAPANGRNGSVKNLPAVDDETGFDSRTQANRYRPQLRVDPPVRLAPGDALVSSISVDRVGATERWLFDHATGSPVRTVSILTSVARPQPPDAFRPFYAGRGSPIYYSRNLRRNLLPRLARVPGTPSPAEYAQHFRRPWVDALFFGFDAPIEYMPDYGREVARAVGNAGLLLTLDYPPRRKEALLVYLAQYGIDLWGLVRKGHSGWPAHGGHGSGRKFPIVLAGTLLGNRAMQRPRTRFGEDMQTMLGRGWTGARALYAGHHGREGTRGGGPLRAPTTAGLAGHTGRGLSPLLHERGLDRRSARGPADPGRARGLESPRVLAYADRWMTEDDSAALATITSQTGHDYSSIRQRRAWDDFVTSMWRRYRGRT
jgi:hypothetical protein